MVIQLGGWTRAQFTNDSPFEIRKVSNKNKLIATKYDQIDSLNFFHTALALRNHLASIVNMYLSICRELNPSLEFVTFQWPNVCVYLYVLFTKYRKGARSDPNLMAHRGSLAPRCFMSA